MPFNLQAALGYAQFKRMDELVEKKRWIWRSYSERLSDVKDIFLNPEQKDVFNGAWVTALIFGDSHSIDRDKAIQELSKKDVPVRPFFYPLSSLPAYFDKEKKYHELNPVSYKISNNGINLPCALNIQEREIDIISKAIHELLEY